MMAPWLPDDRLAGRDAPGRDAGGNAARHDPVQTTLAKNGWRDLTGNLRVSYLIFGQDRKPVEAVSIDHFLPGPLADDAADDDGVTVDWARYPGREGRTRGYQFRSDESEIVFAASATADNGMTYGFTVELQSQTNDRGNADETWMFLDGGDSWGRIEMGDQDGAADRMFVGGEDSMPGRGGYDGAVGDAFIFSGDSAFNSPGFDTTGDATKIIYFSPRFGGLQLGASYTPDSGQEGGAGINDRNANREDTISLGANFQTSTDDFGLTIGAGIEFGDHERTAASAYDGSWNRWGFGGKLTFAGFEVSSGFVTQSDVGVWRLDEQLSPTPDARGLLTGAGIPDAVGEGDDWWANIGLKYTTGPWKIGGGYFYSYTDLDGSEEVTRRANALFRTSNAQRLAENAGGQDPAHPLTPLLSENLDTKVRIFSIGANYNVAPGFDIATDINFVDEETFTLYQTGPGAVSRDSDGTVFVLSTIMSF